MLKWTGVHDKGGIILSKNKKIVIAIIFAFISTWGSYYYSDKIVLSLNKARPATKEENQKLVNILDALVISSGLSSTPKLYIVEDTQPNAFATGRNPENAVICVTTGLLDKLEYYELEGVVAHEMAHIKNYDIRLSAVVSVMVGFVVILSDWFTRISFYGGRRGRDGDNDNMVTRIINSRTISFDKERLEKYHGFPYIAGIDIFPFEFSAVIPAYFSHYFC